MAGFDDDRPLKKRTGHTLGEDLTTLSIGELAERIDLLKTEIVRLEAAVADRRRTKDAAGAFFKS